MVLVDTSIWIGYFSAGSYDALDDLILEDLVVTNDVILSELIPYLKHVGNNEAVHAMQGIQFRKLDIYWEALRQMQLLNLKNGINKVGIPDLIVAQHAIQNNFEIWTNDKHFYLMENIFEIKLF
jgi:hypothetical protein